VIKRQQDGAPSHRWI